MLGTYLIWLLTQASAQLLQLLFFNDAALHTMFSENLAFLLKAT